MPRVAYETYTWKGKTVRRKKQSKAAIRARVRKMIAAKAAKRAARLAPAPNPPRELRRNAQPAPAAKSRPKPNGWDRAQMAEIDEGMDLLKGGKDCIAEDYGEDWELHIDRGTAKLLMGYMTLLPILGRAKSLG